VVDNRLPVGQNTTTYAYDPASNVATVTYPTGLVSSFTYDDLNRLKSLNAYQYQLGPTGNRTSAAEPNGRTLNWTYDGIYRLTNETITLDPRAKNGMVGYGLDPVGNRLTQTSTLPGISSGTATFDANDRLSTETYDANGNTLTTGGKTLAYDFENRLKTMNGAAVALQYDGDGNRVAKTVGGTTTRYLVDDLNPTGYAQVVEEVVGSAVQRTYTYGLQRINQNQLISSTWVPSFYGNDGFGSVRMLTDASGTVTATYDYDAWGNAVNTTGSTPNIYLFRSEQYDADLGLYYLRARYFSPLTGRFLSPDPLSGIPDRPASFERYVYASADPVNLLDPSGMTDDEEAAMITAADLMAIGKVFIRSQLTPNPIQDSIACIWGIAGSWLELGNTVANLPGYLIPLHANISMRACRAVAKWAGRPKRPYKIAPRAPGAPQGRGFGNPPLPDNPGDPGGRCTEQEKQSCRDIYSKLCHGTQCYQCALNCLVQCYWPRDMCPPDSWPRPKDYPGRIPPSPWRIQ